MDEKIKEKLSMLLAIIMLLITVVGVMFAVVKFIDNYKNYEVDEMKIIVECDEFYYDIDNKTYICSNELYTIQYYTRTLLDLSKEYQIEAYYVKTSWLHHLLWWNNPKAVQIKKLVVRSD